jgi:hypothetical protein
MHHQAAVSTVAMRRDEMSEESIYPGTCFCGAVSFTVTGSPVAMGYCHCESCRHWSAGPVNAFTLWKPASVRVTKGAEEIASYQKTPTSLRKWCRRCGGHLFAEHPHWDLTDVYAPLLRNFPFESGVHVNYQEAFLRIHDGSPKQRNLPKEMGGSGELIPE